MAAVTVSRIPLSTYRLQFNRAFTFTDAARIVPYLHGLGISDVYASSYLKAVPGSIHGYDLTDPTSFNPEVGTEEEYQVFIQALKAHGMGQILDVIPNHMGIARSSNAWWSDVMDNGPSSSYARFFDIDWRPIKAELKDKVLLPILGDLYGLVLENQEITLECAEGNFWIHYYDDQLPVSSKSCRMILTHRLDELITTLGNEDPGVQELQSIVTALNHLPFRSERDPARLVERNREKEIVKKRLAALIQNNRTIEQFVMENIRLFNGTKGDPASFDLLDALLDDQAYRLAFWRVAAEEINYRRFFDINELVAVRMEDPVVFEAFHSLIFRLLQQGSVTGLRIDHVDGLYDPAAYLRQLQAAVGERSDQETTNDRSLYLIVEKILGAGETLPSDWPVSGTTGYDFLTLLNGLFVDGANAVRFEDIYARFTGTRVPYDELVYEKKKLTMAASMASEINVLGYQLDRLSEKDRRSRDFTLNSLIHAIREIIAWFPVYRTYIAPTGQSVTDRDRAYIRLAVLKAKRRHPALSTLVFDFVRDLLLEPRPTSRQDAEEERLAFVMKFQQTTSPVTAKGIEDTTFYIFNRLVSLNEVGGDPEQFGVAVSSFHGVMRERQVSWPHTLSATSTHDTKRSEDVRARINVLSEVPELWKSHLQLWSKLNKKYKTDIEGQPAPDRNEEYLLYQTLLGTWPLEPPDEGSFRVFCDRIQAYTSKALHESKVHTSWVNPNHLYDAAVQKFIEAILDRSRPNLFLESLVDFVQTVIIPVGLCNALSQVLIKITAPGIPDFYQGTELWDFSLVDPDNRRPIDYSHRARLLAELQQACQEAGVDRRAFSRHLLETRLDGRIKLYVIMAALNFRQARQELFLSGDYLPLDTSGAKKDHVCAFARSHHHHAAITVVPRLVAELLPNRGALPVGSDAWGETCLVLSPEMPTGSYRNLYTGETSSVIMSGGHATLPVSSILQSFPVALLEPVG
jgi:(1->4)-alpha-D-glucan 1-alpha-D-glucosylmutase